MSSIFNDFFNLNKDNREVAEIKYVNQRKSKTEMIKIKATVSGRVQGVGFRFTTRHLANKLGINGIVQNKDDGSVYVEATGNKNQMDQFIAELAKGPSPSAIVDKVVIEYDNSLPDYQAFSERY